MLSQISRRCFWESGVGSGAGLWIPAFAGMGVGGEDGIRI